MNASLEEIQKIDWSQYHTAYGNAGEEIRSETNILVMPKVAEALTDLFSENLKVALEAANRLWAGLCHQHAYVSSAARPAYPVLIEAFQVGRETLKIELLDIFVGFAYCTARSEPGSWADEIYQMLVKDQHLFVPYTTHEDEEMSEFAKTVLEALEDTE